MFTNDFAMECGMRAVQHELERINSLRFGGHRGLSAEESAKFDKEFAETQKWVNDIHTKVTGEPAPETAEEIEAWINKIHVDVTGEPAPETPEETEAWISKIKKEMDEFDELFDKELSDKFNAWFESDNELDREFYESF